MTTGIIAFVCLFLAVGPCVLFLANLLVYRRIRGTSPDSPQCEPIPELISVLIPARNEEQNIAATLTSVLANKHADYEVVVLDDHSTDRTAEIVREFGARHPRVRLESAPPLPEGWCGKQHACHVLSRLARGNWLVFLDADVRLQPDALVRMRQFIVRTGAALASGVPRQETRTFGEQLLLPLIHFVLLAFLPMHAMRRTLRPAFSAGCGQLFIASKAAYLACGGHSELRNSLHDGIQLPRAFRRAGYKTDLFDATDLAVCRMYHSSRETWQGLGKNAVEGLAAPATIIPMTFLLFGGQVLPFLLLLGTGDFPSYAIMVAACAAGLAWTPRFIAAFRFQQPLLSAVLHPVGILALLAIQWLALLRHCRSVPATWKGRAYLPPPRSRRLHPT